MNNKYSKMWWAAVITNTLGFVANVAVLILKPNSSPLTSALLVFVTGLCLFFLFTERT